MPKELDGTDVDEVSIDAVEDLDDLTDDDLLDGDSLDDVIDDDDDGDDDLADLDDEAEGGDDGKVVVSPVGIVVPVEGEDNTGDDEDDEDIDDDDIEAGLDVILKERLVVEDDEEEDEDEPSDAEDRGDGTLRVLPKQPGEFVCRSCFLVKSESQLADARRGLCRDCV
ncbi:MAG: DUF4193 family protein [Acidimicrobiales bacterium]